MRVERDSHLLRERSSSALPVPGKDAPLSDVTIQLRSDAMSSRVRNSGEFPEGYVPFRQIHEELPDPELFSVSEAVTLEALHLPGPEPEIVFIHGGLGSLWNPFPQLYVFRGEQGLLTYALAGNGGSSTRPEQTIEGHVADLKNLTDRLGVDRPLVHGHSYGTAIAIECGVARRRGSRPDAPMGEASASTFSGTAPVPCISGNRVNASARSLGSLSRGNTPRPR